MYYASLLEVKSYDGVQSNSAKLLKALLGAVTRCNFLSTCSIQAGLILNVVAGLHSALQLQKLLFTHAFIQAT